MSPTPEDEPLVLYEECKICEDGVAQLVEWEHRFPYLPAPDTVELTCTVEAYSCPKCGMMYMAPGSEERIDARVEQYKETGE